MPSEVIIKTDGGGAIIHVLRRTPSCAYCQSPGTQLCDFKLPSGKTCDRPICMVHTYRPRKGIDYCREHRPL